jgi:hypothetical protein
MSCATVPLTPPQVAALAAESRVTNKIDGVVVTQAEFDGLLASLRPEQRHWTCAETNDGGVVTYERADAEGRVWRIREVSSTGTGNERVADRLGSPP